MNQLHPNFDVKLIWKQIRDVCAKTVLTIMPRLWGHTNAMFGDNFEEQCFQIIGLDILIDQDGNARLLEGNSAPNLEADTGLDCFQVILFPFLLLLVVGSIYINKFFHLLTSNQCIDLHSG
jgi:hypothetical protein